MAVLRKTKVSADEDMETKEASPKNVKLNLGTVAHHCNSSTPEGDSGGSLRDQGQPISKIEQT